MSKYRSILALALALVMTLFIAFSAPAQAKSKAKPKTYTAEQIETIQTYAADIMAMRDRFSELEGLIEAENWVFVRNFIHGPLGDLRFKMSGIARELFPESQKRARDLTRDVFKAVNAIDQAAADKNYRAAKAAYKKLNQELAEFFDLFVAT
jgi:photosystem II protein PsbQ